MINEQTINNSLTRTCSLGKFDNVFSLENITHEEIEYVENLITTKMLDIIQTKLDPVLFFGEYFAETPSRFEFTCAEKKQIMQISKCINQMTEEEKKRMAQLPENNNMYFQNAVYNTCASGWFFKKSTPTDTSLNSGMENKLFQSMKSVLQKYAHREYKQLQQSLTIELVSIKQKNGDSIGVITCVLCQDTVKISMKRVDADKGTAKYWITSNFSKHLKESHGLKKQARRL